MYEPLTLHAEVQSKDGQALTARSKILFGPTDEGQGAENIETISMPILHAGQALYVAFYKGRGGDESLFRQKLSDLYVVGKGDHMSLEKGGVRIHINVMRDMVKGLWKKVQTSVPTRESTARKDIFEGGSMRFRCTLCNKTIHDVAIIAGGKDTLVGGRGVPEWRYCSWACRLADDTPENGVNAIKLELLWEGKSF